MVKLVFFVRCASWKNYGYKNVHYFITKKQAREWANKNDVEIRSIETVSQDDVLEDFMGGYY